MPAPLTWTELADDTLFSLRAQGRSWDAIAAVLGISRWAASERGRRIGAQKPPAPPPAEAEEGAREPLPAGHPVSWGAITAGTVLDGLDYPFPQPGAQDDDTWLEWAA